MEFHDTTKTNGHTRRKFRRRCPRRAALGAGIILISWIVFGSIILLGSIGVMNAEIGKLWPLILVVAGANLLLTGGRYRWRELRKEQ